MELLVKEIGNKRIVSGRELHGFLEVGRDFSTWIKGRIKKYKLKENVDFSIIEIFPQNGGKINKGRPQKDYLLNIDTAKSLAMIENNHKGEMAREYFIQCEQNYIAMMEAQVRLHNNPVKPLIPLLENDEVEAIKNLSSVMKMLEQGIHDELIKIDALRRSIDDKRMHVGVYADQISGIIRRAEERRETRVPLPSLYYNKIV